MGKVVGNTGRLSKQDRAAMGWILNGPFQQQR